MIIPHAALLLGTALLSPIAGDATVAAGLRGARLQLAQATDGTTAPLPNMLGGGNGVSMPGDGAAAPPATTLTTPTIPTTQGGAPSTTATPPAANTASSPPTQLPTPTVATRNGAAALPTLTQPGIGPQYPSTTSSVTFGGPQLNNQPVYGSTLRDNGAGNNGTPTYSSAPSTLGGPINGTANSYYATLPDGAAPPGQATSRNRGSDLPNGVTPSTRQPLGGSPYTRDQTGTFGNRAGYNGQGVYNGTAAQTGNGLGYGSPYAPSGRPTGGLLSTGVDATGPLRPYIPQNSGTITRPNSGYGVPNGSRSTHMDARGIQRMD